MTTKVPAELSSTPSIVDNGNATAFTIDSSERILIGTNNTYNAEADNLIIYDPGNAGLTIATGSTSGNNTIHFADGTSGDAQYRGVIEYEHNDDSMRFKVNGEQEKVRILSTGGITFNGDTSTNNALDDYEEGTWTPATYSGTLATATGTARYHKIGGLVVASCRVNTFSDTSGGDHVRITGLPFRIVTPANKNCGYAWSNEATVYFYGQPNETQVWLYHNGSSGFQDVEYNELSSSTQYMCLFTYFTDQ